MLKGMWASFPMGMLGIQTDMGSSELPIQSLIRAENINFAPGYIEKAPGAILYNLNGAFPAGVVGLIDYWPNSTQQRLFAATSNGKIYKDYGDRSFSKMTAIATNAGNGILTNKCQFVIGGNEVSGNPKLIFLFTGNAQVQVFSGDSNTMAAMTLPATDWPNPTASSNPQSIFPKFGMIHRGRLWAFNKSIAYASSTTNHQDFQTANAYLVNNVGPGEGGDIIGGFVYKSRMFLFKEGGYVYYLNDTDNTSTNWYFTKFAEGLTTASIHSAIQVIDDLLVGNDTGVVTSYTATLNYGNVKQGDIFKQMKASQYYRQYTSITGAPYMHSLYYSEKGLAMFSTRSTYTTKNDCIIQMDFSNPAVPKFGLWNHYQADCLALRRDLQSIQRPIYGAANGYVYMADRSTRAVNGAAYTANFKTPYFDMRHLDPTLASKDKIFDVISCVFTPDGNHNLSVDVWIDGQFSETVTLNQTVDTNYLGAFKLGTSILGSEEEHTVYAPLHGQGKRISLRGYNANALESFKVSSLNINFRVAGENPTILPGQGG